jgi:hypothetical protein
MSTIRGTGGSGFIPSTQARPTGSSAQKSTSAPTAYGYSSASSFDAGADQKAGLDAGLKVINDASHETSGFINEAFSSDRLATLKKEASKELMDWVKANPKATRDQVESKAEDILNKMETNAWIEHDMFDRMFKDLMSSYEKSLSEMKRIFEGG